MAIKIIKAILILVIIAASYVSAMSILLDDRNIAYRNFDLKVELNKIQIIKNIDPNSNKTNVYHAKICLINQFYCKDNIEEINLKKCVIRKNPTCIIYEYLLVENKLDEDERNHRLNNILDFCPKLRSCEILIFEYLLNNEYAITDMTKKNVNSLILKIIKTPHLLHKLKNVHKKNPKIESLLKRI